MAVWRSRNTAYQQEHIVGATAFGGSDLILWGSFSLNFKLDLFVLGGTLTGQTYRDRIMCPLVVHHFDRHP